MGKLYTLNILSLQQLTTASKILWFWVGTKNILIQGSWPINSIKKPKFEFDFWSNFPRLLWVE